MRPSFLGVEPGIKGRLAFFSIGVWVTPLLLVYTSIQAWIEVSKEFEKFAGRPLDFSTTFLILERVSENWSAALFFATMGGFVALIGVSIWLITQWWRRKRQFPRNWIILQAGSLVIMIIAAVNNPQDVQPRDVFASVAHILFWWKSKGVAATFTQ